jgi:OCT family organic cation transporter-like MFS transporter 4/5
MSQKNEDLSIKPSAFYVPVKLVLKELNEEKCDAIDKDVKPLKSALKSSSKSTLQKNQIDDIQVEMPQEKGTEYQKQNDVEAQMLIIDSIKTAPIKSTNINLVQPLQKPTVKKVKPTRKNLETNLDGLLEHVGSFGLYQKLQFLLVGFLAILPGMIAFSYVFVSATPKFTCGVVREIKVLNTLESSKIFDNIKLDDSLINPFEEIELENAEFLIETKRFIRLISKDQIVNRPESIDFDSNCRLDKSQTLNSILATRKESKSFNQTNVKKQKSSYKCVEWVYDESMYGETTVSSWDLVCLESHLKALTQNTFILGTGCSVFTGIISDKFGRKHALILLITLLVVVLNATQFLMHTAALTRNQKFTIFTISRFFQGVGTTLYSVGFVLLLEITGPKHRVTAGNILAYSFSIGQMILVGIAYYFKNWLKIKWVIALYVLPFFAYYWLVPESPRWLLSVNKIQKARLIIKKISRVNSSYKYLLNSFGRIVGLNYFIEKSKDLPTKTEKKIINEESWMQMFSILQDESSKLSSARQNASYKNTLKEILKCPNLLKRCFILCYTWMVVLACYLGIGMGMSGNLDKIFDPYVVFLIAAFFEFFSILTCQFVLNRYGRKYPLIVFMLMSSISIYLIPYFFKSQPLITLIFYFISKYSIGAAQLTCMIFTSELYPTPIRSTGVGMSVAIARLGGVWAPQINVLSSTFDSIFVPFIIFSMNAFLAAIFCSFLPETLNKKLPENTSQAEQLDRKK